jgi:serine/threonine protein kinase
VRGEIAIMKKLQHPNIVQVAVHKQALEFSLYADIFFFDKLFEVIDDEQADKLYMILELEELGEIMQYDTTNNRFRAKYGQRVPRNDTIVFSEECAQQYMREIVAGLHYIHCQGICHRDIKPGTGRGI